MEKLYSLSATQMKDLLDKKEVSSVEITKSVIERIENTFYDHPFQPHQQSRGKEHHRCGHRPRE